MKCDKCNGIMKKILNGNVQGWECPDCGWNIITTYIDEMYSDVVEYTVYITVPDKVDKSVIQFVSKVANISCAQAYKLLKEDKFCLLKAKAPIVKDVLNKLQELKVEYSVSPAFKY